MSFCHPHIQYTFGKLSGDGSLRLKITMACVTKILGTQFSAFPSLFARKFGHDVEVPSLMEFTEFQTTGRPAYAFSIVFSFLARWMEVVKMKFYGFAKTKR